MGATHALTLTLNRPSSFHGLQKKVRRFFRDLDRRLFGPRHHKVNPILWTSYVAFGEHLDTNAHVHAAVRVVHDRHEKLIEVLGGTHSKVWSKIAPAGSHVLRPYLDDGWAAYSTKYLDCDSGVLLSR